MFDATSRYYSVGVRTVTRKNRSGTPRQIRYAARRFLPRPEEQTLLVEHSVREGERLDTVTARYLGDPTQFWRVCDANGALDPEDLTASPGRVLRIAAPLPGGSGTGN